MDSVLEYTTGLLVVMFGELILSREPFIMIIMFQMSLILPKLIVRHDTATFQAMMNNLFRDMINKGDIATFIDDVLVATETEEGYDKIVEEVLR